MALSNPPTFLQSGSHDAESFRQLTNSLIGGSSGVSAVDDMEVTQSSSVGMSVDVATGSGFVVGTSSSLQGAYHCTNESTTTVSISASDPSNDRIDLIVLQVVDSEYVGGSTNEVQLNVVEGTAAASPSAPSVPASSLLLAEVLVEAGVTSILNAAITDRRALAKVAAAAGSPTGTLNPFAGASAPTGWLLCDGTAVSRTLYADLFTVVGTAYGAGNGSTTFNLPDFGGRVPVGLDASDSSMNQLGETGGSKTHTLTQAELPAHSHSINHNHASATTSSRSVSLYGSFSPDHAHAGGVNRIAQSGIDDPGGSNTQHTAGGTDSHSHTFDVPSYSGTSGSTGSGNAHSIQNPFIAVNYIIKF